MATTYAWNTSPIDGTDIIRSVSVIGQELRYHFYISLTDTPAMIDNPSDSVTQYSRYLQRGILFSQHLLVHFVEDWRLIHREHIN